MYYTLEAPKREHPRPTNALVTDLFQRNLKWTIRAAQTASQEGPASSCGAEQHHEDGHLIPGVDSGSNPLDERVTEVRKFDNRYRCEMVPVKTIGEGPARLVCVDDALLNEPCAHQVRSDVRAGVALLVP